MTHANVHTMSGEDRCYSIIHGLMFPILHYYYNNSHHTTLGGWLGPSSIYPKALNTHRLGPGSNLLVGYFCFPASQEPRFISAACFLNCLVGIFWANIPSSSLKVRSLNSGTSNQAQIRLRKERAIQTNADLPPKSAGEIECQLVHFQGSLGIRRTVVSVD